MSELGHTLREARSQRGLRQEDVEAATGVARTLWSRRETGQLSVPHKEIERFVQATGVSLVVTPEGWDIHEPPEVEALSFGGVPCGRPLPIDEDETATQVGFRELTDGAWGSRGCCYLVQADGDSMEPSVAHGDWLVVHRRDGLQPKLWDLVVAVVEGSTLIAQVQPHPERAGEHVLGKVNPDYGVDLSGDPEVRLLGIVLGALRWRPLR